SCAFLSVNCITSTIGGLIPAIPLGTNRAQQRGRVARARPEARHVPIAPFCSAARSAELRPYRPESGGGNLSSPPRGAGALSGEKPAAGEFAVDGARHASGLAGLRGGLLRALPRGRGTAEAGALA